jgi:peptide/nickel transport system substrate-binding protein
VRKHTVAIIAALAAVAGVVLAACGGASTGVSGAERSGGTITIVGDSPPGPDQGYDFSVWGAELYSVVNTPLLAFVRGVQGPAGSKIIPALASSMPTVSNGGTTYTFHLRKGLHFSNGAPILAGDETYALERDLRIPWGGASFLTSVIKGAAAYANCKARTISGITTNDSTGAITVNLAHRFAPIVDIFAMSATAPVPRSTPMKNLPSTGTIGDGPYKWGPITPKQTYTLVRNTKFDVPGLPRGHADKIVFSVDSNGVANAEAVLRNQADVFDPADTLPPSILGQVRSTASDRYQAVPANTTEYFFFAVNEKPFNNIYARKAVLAALDLRALSRLDSGSLAEDCHLIPSGILGHSAPATCSALTGHNPAGRPNMTLAKSLMKKSGMSGQSVTVWGSPQSPVREYVDYYTSVLNSLGFRATERIVSTAAYWTTIGAKSTKPQTGFGYWLQDFPHPWDFMQLNTCTTGSSLNYGYVCDSHYDSAVKTLDALPLASVASRWSALDNYAVNKGYYAAFGHQTYQKFYSNRLVFKKGVVSVEYATDLTSLELKK